MAKSDLSLFRSTQPAVRYFTLGTVAAAIGIWCLALGPLGDELRLLASGGFVILLLLNVVAEASFVTLPSGAKIAASFLVLLISLFLLSPAVTALVAAAGCFFTVIVRQRRHWSIAAFNASQYTLAYVAAGFVVQFFALEADKPDLLPLFWAAGIGSLIYLTISSLIVNTYLGLREGQLVLRFNWDEERWEWMQVIIMWPIAVLAIYLRPSAGWMAVVVPFALTLILIDAIKAFVATQTHNRQLEQLQSITQLIGGARNVDSVWRTLCQQLPKLFAHERFDVYHVDDAKQRLERVASDMIGAPEEAYDLLDLEAPMQRAVAHRQIIRIDDLPEPKPYGELWEETLAVLGAPVLMANDVRYLLVLTSATRRAFDPMHESLLKLLVNQIQVSLENVQLNESIQKQALTDPLTGRYNRRYLNQKIEDELRRAIRHKRPTSILIIDVDYFKRFNDTHGHLLGDAVLRGLGGLLMECVRETDVVARFGGEEFAVFLPETSLEQATEVGERIRTRVAAHPFSGRNGQPVHITLSIGVACSTDAAMTREEMCESADAALYRAKRQGRNQICQATSADVKSTETGPLPDADRALSTGHRVDPAQLQKWAQQLRLGSETIGRQWQDAIDRYPSGGDRPLLDAADVRTLVEHSVDILAERLLLLSRRPDEADRPFGHQGTLFDYLRKEARRSAHQPQSILRLETGLMLLSATMQTFCSGFDGDRSLLRLLIDRLMIAVHTAVTDSWLEQLSQTQQDLRAILRATQTLNRLNDPIALADVAAKLLAETLACDGAVLVETDGDGLVVRGQAGTATPKAHSRLPRLPMESVRRAGSPTALTSPWPDFPGDLIAAPVMLSQGRSLLIGWSKNGRHFRLEELRVAEELAAQVVATHERLLPWDLLPDSCDSPEPQPDGETDPALDATGGR